LETVIFLSDKLPIKKISAAFFENTFPLDLALAVVWLAANILVIYLPVLSETAVSAIFILPGILFLPGYCLIAALFPVDGDIDLTERIALSFGLSIAIVPLIGLGLNFTPFGIRLDSILVSLTIITLAMILVAHYRRSLLPFEKRFRFPFVAIARTLQNAIFPKGDNRVDQILAVVITLAILAAVLTTVYMIAVPREGERFTEFFILGENKSAADYPDQIIAGQNYSLFIGVGNHEYRDINYTIETWIMREEFDNVTNTSTLRVMDPGERLVLPLAHNDTMIIPYNLYVKKTGYNRVEFLLFKDTVPGLDVTGRDRIDASYKDLNLWLTVQ
jgi:uncharacterized membrane protein